MIQNHAWALSQFAALAWATGEAADAAACAHSAEEALRLARDSGSAVMLVEARLACSIASLLLDRPHEARATLEDALAQARTQRAGRFEEARLLCYLGLARLALGDGAAARAVAAEAVSVAAHQGAGVLECFAQLVRTRIWRETADGEADLAAARTALTAGETLAAVTGAAMYSPFLAEQRARLDNDLTGLQKCAAAYDSIGATGHARRLRVELGA